MKRFSLVHMLVLLAAIVTLASCGMTQPLYEDGYERQPSRRVYADPYYGNQTVLVRDPYTGQYYEVIPNSSYGYGYPSGTYYPNNSRYYGNRYGNSRGYSRGSNRNSAPVYRNGNSNNSNNNNSNNNSSNSDNGSRKIDRAKDIINGRN